MANARRACRGGPLERCGLSIPARARETFVRADCRPPSKGVKFALLPSDLAVPGADALEPLCHDSAVRFRGDRDWDGVFLSTTAGLDEDDAADGHALNTQK